MIIKVAGITEEGDRIQGEESAGILELGQDHLIRIDSPIRYDFMVQKVGHELLVTGQLAVDVAECCSRCADFFSTTLKVSSFLRGYPVPEGTETVDLTQDIREDILLSLPAFYLCSPTCKGLCAKCGKNLNEGPCSCRTESTPVDRWSELDKLDI